MVYSMNLYINLLISKIQNTIFYLPITSDETKL